jgi:hypothetical protein
MGCPDKEQSAPAPPPEDTWEDICIDDDHDGYGLQCDKGSDCDDSDETIFEGCAACAKPNEGCECSSDSAPLDCTLSKEITSDGTLLCKTGTRYCRDSKWSGCEGVKTFSAPPPSKLLASSLIDPDAGLVICSSCSPDCYQVDETPASDAGYGDGSLAPGAGGGITISRRVVDGDGGLIGDSSSGPQTDSGLLDDPDCIPGTAPDFDCDGIPDAFDPLPGSPPFSSDHNTIFMDLAPGDTQEETFEVRFYLNTADIYLYLDMTGSMDGEKNNLIASLRDGNYMANAGVGVECSDRNFNGSTSDEEYLKNEGIAGNLACMIRDSRLGAGWHRDLPLPKADAMGFAFGPHDFEAFQHEQDITSDVNSVLTSLGRFATRGGINRPEGGILGLYALTTGGGFYMGWNRPGNMPRTGCPTGTWGYPCFRDDAVPIVIWMTDAPITNGPSPAEGIFERTNQGNQYNWTRDQPINWDSQALEIETGTGSAYIPVDKTHEDFASALDLGDINNSFKTYFVDTTGMASNITYNSLVNAPTATFLSGGSVCMGGTVAWSTTQTAPDTVFKFRVTENEPITISTKGSRWRPAIAIVDARRIAGTQPFVAPTTANALPTAPYNLGTLDLTKPTLISGTTAGASSVFSRDALGCLASNTGSSDKQGAVVLKFNLPSDATNLKFTSDMNSAVATTLFSGRPMVPTDAAMSSSTAYINATSRTKNVNDEINAYNLGNLTGAYRRFTGGDTTDTDLNADYSAAMFANVGNCTNPTIPQSPTGTARDAVWDFSLSAATHVRIETGGDNATLVAGFDHMIGLVSRTAVGHAVTGNITDATAYPILPSEMPSGQYDWLQYTGALAGTAATYLQSEVGPFVVTPTATDCNNATGATSATTQAVFVMDVTTTKTYQFDTAGSGASNWISLHKDNADVQRSATATNANNSGGVMALAGIDEQSVFVTGGTLATHGTLAVDYAAKYVDMGCDATTTNGGRDVVYSFTVASAQTVDLTLGATAGTPFVPGEPAFNGRLAVFRNSISNANRVAGGCDDPTTGTTGYGYSISNLSVSPGNTYLVVVKAVTAGTLTTPQGYTYGLWIRDTTFNSHFVTCDYGSQLHVASVRAAKITRSLTPGRYYVVVKGTNASSYRLNVRIPPSAEPTLMDCNHDGVGTRRSVIDRTLPAGNYSVILRGYSQDVNGTYNLYIRDVDAAPTPISCGYDANGILGPATPLTQTLAARDGSGNLIDYYMVMRGNNSTGGYAIRIDPQGATDGMADTQCAYDNVNMVYSRATPVAYSVTTDVNSAEWTGTLPLGEYYAVVKGYDATATVGTYAKNEDYGPTQFTIGDQLHFEGLGQLAAPRWLGTNGDGADGVRKALLDRNVRVIMVDSTQGSGDNAFYSDQQGKIIASATGAVATDGTPLFFKINSDGTGLGTAIVDAVNQLAGNLAMDVGVRLVESPDSPAPKHFNIRIEAVDGAGDGCRPPVDTDLDAEHLPDTHVKCIPGAVPRFKISMSNPVAPNNVPRNRADAQGGYNMRLELIGDGQFVVDSIPIYIIPDDVILEAGDARYDESAVYEQSFDSHGCFGNEAPLWRDLQWSADIPSGTTVTWNICTADTAAELPGCTLQLAASVQTGSDCINDSNCPGGYCNAGKVCEYVLGPICSSTSDCGINGECNMGRCRYTKNPMDVKPALVRGLQGKAYARMQVIMSANAERNHAPTIYNWGLKYTCSAQE